MGRLTPSMLLNLGSRASALAKIQTLTVGNALKTNFPNLRINYHFQESKGDKDLSSPLWKLSGQGIFTKDLQDALLAHKIDGIVHSWKDLDLNDRKDTKVISVLPREDQRDVIFLKKKYLLSPPNALTIYTSSPRREYNITPFIREYFPSSLSKQPITFESVRGNIQTRFKKFMESDISCLIVAKAAIDRLILSTELIPEISELSEIQNFLKSKMEECAFMLIPLSLNPCAPAQGAICVEVRKDDKNIHSFFEKISHNETSTSVLKERAILKQFGGGCHQKIGVSIISRPYGEISYLKGQTEEGIILNEIKCSNQLEIQFHEKNVWPNLLEKPTRERSPIEVTVPADKDLYITKSFALPENAMSDLKNRILWTSGIATWKDLAKRNIWVNGTSDGLGEMEEINIQSLTNRSIRFIKLTHDESQNYFLPTLQTYHLSSPEIPNDFLPEKIYAAYWNSGSEFLYLVEKFPILKDIHHFCGPGSSYTKIKQYLGENGKITISPSFQYWKETYIKTAL
jgi:hydroxymethylbilane synthase